MKFVRLAAVLAIPVVLVSCVHQSALGPISDDAHISFQVADTTDMFPLADVEVYLLTTRHGMIRLGITGENGRLEVGKSVLRQPGAVALLFCRGDFFCGALRIQEDQVLEFEDVLVHLAPFAIS